MGGTNLKKSTKMVEEITAKRKMPQNVKDDLKKRILHNSLLAIGVIVCLILVVVLDIYAKQEIVAITRKVIPMVFILLTIGIFEVAYRKESGKMAIVGIEWLIVSILVLYIPKMDANWQGKMGLEQAVLPIVWVMYYGIKMMIISVKTKKEYQNNLSDIKEIVKE